MSAFSVVADGGALRAVVGVLPPPPPVGQARYLTILGLLEDPAIFGGDILALPPTFCSSHAIASIFIMLGSIFYMENYYLVWDTN